MNPWPIRLAVIGGMAAAALLWVGLAPLYIEECYDFDRVCANHGWWRVLYLAGPPLIGILVGVIVHRAIKRIGR